MCCVIVDLLRGIMLFPSHISSASSLRFAQV
jgi:hypothetical protein